jgi:PAS domain S-box-containing protein
MSDGHDDEEAMRSVALQNAQSIFLARQRAERELLEAKEALERRSEELAQQREWFRVALSSIGDAVITTDTEAKVTFLNPVAELLTGWNSIDAWGQPLEKVFVIINEDTRRPVQHPIGKVLREGSVIALANHTALIARDGRETPIEDSAAPIRNASGAIMGAVMVFHDVTEGRRSERALLQSEARLNLAMEAAKMGAWEWDMASNKVTWSPTLETIHGLLPGTFGGSFEEFRDYIHPQDRERVLTRIRECVGRREEYQIEYRNTKPTGAICWVESRGKLLMDDEGKPERMTGICMDITVRKQVEEEQSRLAAVVEFSDDAIVSKTLTGVITTWNKGAARIFGYSAEEMIGHSIARLIPPDRQDEERDILRRMRAGEHVEHYETVRVTKDGRLIDVSLTISPLRDARGTIIGASKIAREITERKQVEADLRAARDAAESANRAKDEFLAALSHELRTPLTPVLIMAAEMEQAEELPEEVRASFAMIRRNVELEARIIDDLLDLTRITHGKLALRNEVVDVHGLIGHTLAILRSDAEAKNLSIVLNLGAAGHHVSGDAVRLQQVFWNVLKNAIKFTPQGGRITIRSWNEDDLLRVATTDTGLGITPEEMPRIFTAFEQGREAAASRFGGLGLGLSITALLVREHRGRIWAESAGRDQGTTFHLELTVVAAPASQKASSPFIASPNVRPLSVLLVEDHEDTRRTLQRLMTRWGHEVTVAASLAQARDVMANGSFDLLLSDLGLADGTGYDVIAAFREKSEAPAVAMSGYGMEADVANTQAAGFTDHVVKPISAEHLRELLTRIAAG